MTEEALISWMESGSNVVVAEDEALAKRNSEFSRRFVQAMSPSSDLGSTEEEHQMGVASAVFEVHSDLNALGEEAYCAVWQTLAASTRAAIKKYVALATRSLT